MPKSPFKFLDSFTKEDKAIFFGRERETEELYQKIFESKILLVYGVSGTGKSSLIHCGLANKFNDSDWLPINIRRGGDINESLAKALDKYSISEVSQQSPVNSQQKNALPTEDCGLKTSDEKSTKPTQPTKPLTKLLKNLYLDHFKPIYLIFDQFEELFIFGSKTEKEEFIQNIKQIVDSEIQCKFLFVIREEYLAGITEFEREIPSFLQNRIRIEKMTRTNAVQCIEGPCKAHGIGVEEGFSEALLEKLSPGSTDVELTYLQVYLDRVFREASKQSEPNQNIQSLSHSIIESLGEVRDLLGSFLEEQIATLDDPDSALAILKSFVSVKGTKRQITEEEINEHCKTIGKDLDHETYKKQIAHFVNIRILRDKDESGRYELRHDALAAKIYKKITLVEKELMEIRQFIENAFENFEKRKVLLSADDLKYIAPYRDKLILKELVVNFLSKSEHVIGKAKRRKRTIAFSALIVLLVIFAGFTWWAMRERKVAVQRETEMFFERQKANSLYITSLSKEVLPKDPTKALRMVEYAIDLNPGNRFIQERLNNVYYENSFYQTIVDLENSMILTMDISPDGSLLLTGSYDGVVNFWTTDGEYVKSIIAHDDPVISASFSPDGSMVITGSYDGTAKLWDNEGNLLQTLDAHSGVVNSCAFSPDGKKIVTGSEDKTAVIWDIKGNQLHTLTGHNESVKCVAFSPDGTLILTTSRDGTASLWNNEGKKVVTYEGHESYLMFSGVFSKCGKYVLTGSSKEVHIWNLSGERVGIYDDFENIIWSIAVSPDNKNVAVGDDQGIVKIFDFQTNMLQQTNIGHTDRVRALVFSNDNRTVYTSSTDNTIKKWEVFRPFIYGEKNFSCDVGGLRISKDFSRYLTIIDNATGLVFRNSSDSILMTYRDSTLTIIDVAISPDNKFILIGYEENIARLIDEKGNVIMEIDGFKNAVPGVAFSEDNSFFALGSRDNLLQIWDIKGQLIKEIDNEAPPTHIKFLPGKQQILALAIGGFKVEKIIREHGRSQLMLSSIVDKGEIKVWDFEGKLIRSGRIANKDKLGTICSVDISPDGGRILLGSGDNNTWLFDNDGKLLEILNGNNQSVYYSKFSNDGKFIMTAYSDKKITIWTLAGIPVKTIENANNIESAAWCNEDEIMLVDASFTMKKWKLQKNYYDFRKSDLYDALSIREKLEYDILNYEEVFNLSTEEMTSAAEYYIQLATETGKPSEVHRYLKDAEVLLDNVIQQDANIDRLTNRIYTMILMKENDSLYFVDSIKIEKILGDLNEIGGTQTEIIDAADFLNGLSSKGYNNYGFLESSFELYKTICRKDLNYSDKNQIAMNGLYNVCDNYLNRKKYDLAVEAIELAIEIDPEEPYLYDFLPLCYVLNNEFEKAVSVVDEWKEKEYPDPEFVNFREAFLFYMNDFEENGITHPDFAKVRELLKEEKPENME